MRSPDTCHSHPQQASAARRRTKTNHAVSSESPDATISLRAHLLQRARSMRYSTPASGHAEQRAFQSCVRSGVFMLTERTSRAAVQGTRRTAPGEEFSAMQSALSRDRIPSARRFDYQRSPCTWCWPWCDKSYHLICSRKVLIDEVPFEDVDLRHHDGDGHLRHGDSGRKGSKGDSMAREKARGYAGGPQAAHSASPIRGRRDAHADGLFAVWVEIIDE